MVKRLFLLLFGFLSLSATQAQEGFPDPSFGTGGYINLDGNYSGSAIAFQQDGKFVGVQNIAGGFSLTRYNSDGTLDAGFGSGGTVAALIPNMAGGSGALVAVENNGRIVVRVQGLLLQTPPQPDSTLIATVRFNSNGSLDTSFGAGGLVSEVLVVPLPGEISPRPRTTISMILIEDDGKIIAVDGNSAYRVSYSTIHRYNSDGTPGGSLGSSSGFQVSSFGAVVIGNDGKITVGGTGASTINPSSTIFVYRLNNNGTTDASFSQIRYPAGITFPPISERLTDLAVHSNGKVVVLTESNKLLGYNADGTPDLSFGNGGVLLPPFRVVKVLAQDDDGKLIAGGYLSAAGANGHFLLARYNPNGTFDPSFGYGGMSAIYLRPTLIGLEKLAITANRLYAYGRYFVQPGIGSGYLAAFQLTSQSQPVLATTGPLQNKAISEKIKVQKLHIITSPNPATTHFTLRLQGISNEPVQVRVMDAMGRVVEVRSNLAPNTVITLGANYRSGAYYAEVMQGKERITTKLIKGSN